MSRRRFAWLFALVCVLCSPVLGQETTGEIGGTVHDSTGAVIVGAAATIVHEDTDRSWKTKTQEDGRFAVSGLSQGRYNVRVEREGFAPLEFRDVMLYVGGRLQLDAILNLAPFQQTLSVIGAVPLLELTGKAEAHHIPTEEFDRIPKARTFQSLLSLLPSVNSGADQYGNVTGIEGGYQVNGASAAENLFVIDGVATNSLIQGQARQSAVFEFLQDLQVKTAGAEAEYGGALGGVVSAVTKSGGNSFHGEIHFYFSGSSLGALPVRRLLLDPVAQSSASYVQDNKNDDRRTEFGGSIGGYLVRDRLWFFAAASPQWRSQSGSYSFSSGLENGAIRQKQLYQSLFGKLSFDAAPRVRTNFSWLNTPTYSKGRLPAYNFGPNTLTSTLAANRPNESAGFSVAQTSYSGSVEIVLSPKTTLSIRGGRYWDDYKDRGVPNVSSVQYLTSALTLPAELLLAVPEALRQPALFSNTPRFQRSAFDIATRTFVGGDFARRLSLAGAHDIKIGIGAQRNINKADNTFPGGGFVSIFWNSSFNSSLSPPCNTSPGCRGIYGYYTVDDFGTRGSAGATSTEMYLQDRWRVYPRLDVSLGLRTENETVPSFRRDVLDYGFEFGFKDKIAPRLGFAYDPIGTGKLKISANWGIFHDWFKYQMSRGVFGGSVWNVRYRSLDTPNVFALSGTNMPGQDLWDPATPNSFQDKRPLVFRRRCSAENLRNCVAPDLKPLSTAEINARVEYQWGARTILGAGYVHNHLRHTVEDLGFTTGGAAYSYIANPGEGVATISPPSGATQAPIPTPKPVRNYNALELSLSRRFSSGWFLNASYVLSRLYGNYAGLANSDEIATPTTGTSIGAAQQQSGVIARPGTNTSRAWDLAELLFDAHGHLDVKGRLPTDRPNSFKAYGSYRFGFGTEIGGFFQASSGTPISTYVFSSNGLSLFVNGRGDMGRTPVYSRTDLVVAHEVRFGEIRRLRLEFNMLNLFNQKTARHIFNCLNRGCGSAVGPVSPINLSGVDLFRGYDFRALIQARPGQPFDPRYGMKDLFDPGFSGRLGIKFVF